MAGLAVSNPRANVVLGFPHQPAPEAQEESGLPLVHVLPSVDPINFGL
jgi:hypothetical protein